MDNWESITWEYLIGRVRRMIPKLRNLDIDTDWILSGWEFLKRFYGEKGLRWLKEKGFGCQLTNELEWAQTYVGYVGNVLKQVSKRSDFYVIQNRLLNKNEFPSAFLEAEISFQLEQKGIDNEFVEPDENPTPDLLADFNGQQVVIEVHKQGAPDIPLDSPGYNASLYRRVDLKGIVYSGRIHRPISEKHWNEILEKAERAVARARRKGELVTIIDDWIAGPCGVETGP